MSSADSKARLHHYVPKCYLKGFTLNGHNKSMLQVYDIKQKKIYTSPSRNICAERDFNRIDADGVDQNLIETELSKFESELEVSLRALESNPYAFEGKIKGDIITFIAFMSMRLPSMREMWRGFHENIANKIMDMTLHTKDRWESTKARMKADGALKHEDNVTYEQLKSFVDERRCTIQVKNEHHIHTEMLGVETVSPYLFDRNWVVVVSDNNANNFITSDRPTVLSWDEPDKVPLMRRNSPGFGLLGTTVILPVSRKIALIGKFEDTWQEGVVLANRETIAAINAEIASNAHEKIIAPSEKFYLLTPELKAGDGNAMLKSFLGVR